ncbi:DUF63 family protein [Natronobiforma cellulositropha]|uniref:DUF63 family protein n=1 Tax=Natronobiforma cellulositropha TaxID=1679076 RepID=UPI0021D5CE20|nr:DUF63 family protein [Natronobiforma cellulositropha]
MVVPEGFLLPPWYMLVPLVVVLAAVVALLWALEPPVTDETVISFAPWMMLGSTLHVLYKIDAFPPVVEPLFGAPTVYLTTAAVAGFVWILGSFLYAAGLQRSIDRFVGIGGTGFFVVFAMFTLFLGWEAGTFSPFWPVISVVIAGIVAAVAWIALSLWFTDVAAVTGVTGAFVVFSHTLDGVSTAIGYDRLGASEEVPLSRYILEAGEQLPTADLIGAGWVFVLVKVVLALLIVSLFKEYVRERPRQARLILGLVAAVGLGPGVHNVLLFVVT